MCPDDNVTGECCYASFMTTTTKALTVTKIEDREGNGICQCCDRENLRWIVTLSDGSSVGTQCANKIMGHKNYNWKSLTADIAGMLIIREWTSHCETICLLSNVTGTRFAITVNGNAIGFYGPSDAFTTFNKYAY